MRLAVPALTLLCILGSTLCAQADRRVALVMGNGAYKNVQALPNPTIDATSMAAKLRNVGFEVVEGTNLTREAMTNKLIEFGKKAQGADVAVFFYAGHGIAVNGINYLLPIDADLKSEMDVKLGAAIDVDVTLDQTMSDAKVKLVFLDACRDNPFAERIRSAARTRSVTVQTGLAEMKSGEGTLIAFATGPGQTALDGQSGGNSPFTRALLDNIATPGLEIQQAMTKVRAQVNEQTRKQQLPWGHTNLIGTVYLNAAAGTPSDAASSAQPGAMASPAVGSEAEIEFWRSIRDSNKIEELNAYVTTYPNGQFKPLALARIASLQAAPPPATRQLAPGVDPAVLTEEATQLTEDRIGLNQAQRRDVQRRLTGLGFDVRQSGKFEADTRTVITRWQAARGYPSSGFLNRPQYAALLAEAQPTPEPKPVVRQAAPPQQPRMQPAAPPPQRAQPGIDPGVAGSFIGGVIGGAIRR
jgi:uncharacterized caspase-like protein